MTLAQVLMASRQLEYQSIYLLFEATESLRKIKEVLNGNATHGNSKCSSNDIPPLKT